MDNVKEVLQEVFGFPDFKDNQEEIIKEILRKKENVLAIMPTGSGKSLCFQIPALLQKNTTIIISPLIALMKDQVDILKKKGVSSAYFYNSTLDDSGKKIILDKLKEHSVKLLYCAPETLMQKEIQETCKEILVDLLVIDEAHCVSLWGHNFRPDYLKIKYFHRIINSPKILAITATATKEIEKDILNQLSINAKIFRTSFDRPNLNLKVINLPQNIYKEFILLGLLKKIKQPAVIFVTTQRTAENLNDFLQANSFNSKYYHAGLTKEERSFIQDSFMKNKINILVATIAFGMGIDKKDIRTIIHFNIPQSVENYYQEIGRSGRDGKIAECITLISDSDADNMKKLIERSWPKRDKIEKIINCLNSQKIFLTTTRKLSYNSEVNEIAINMVLHHLEEENQILIEPDIKSEKGTNKIKIIRNTEINKDFIEKISNLFNKKKQIDILKIDKLVECLNNRECIRYKILKYFDENPLNKNCNNCSSCTPNKETIDYVINENYVSQEEINRFLENSKSKNDGISNTILSCIIRYDILRKDLVETLTGTLSKSHASWKKEQKIYGILKEFSDKKDILERITEELIKNKMIYLDINGLLKITKKGFEWISSTNQNI